MPASLREHCWPVAASVLLHGLFVLIVVLATTMKFHQSPPSQIPMPIDAMAVDSQLFHAAQRMQADRVAQEAARVQAAADAAAAATAAAAQAAQAATEAAASAAAKAAADSQAAAAAAQAAARQQLEAAQQAAAQQAAQVQRRANADQARAAALADAQRTEAAQKALEAKQAAEAKRASDARQAAEAKQAADAKAAADAKRAADEKAKKDREAELRRQLADEEHVSAVESGPLRDRYISALQNRIQNAWIKPGSASAGIDCMVAVTQVPGGEVTNARVTQCNGDAAVRQSIENAVYRASPLPDPPDPALFERNFVFEFKPK